MKKRSRSVPYLCFAVSIAIALIISGCNNSDDNPDQTLQGGSIQGKALDLTAAVTTFAGSAGTSGNADGFGTDAEFYQPYGVTTDGNDLYVTDRRNNTIRRIDIATGEVTTLAGDASVAYPYGSDDGTGSAALFYEPRGITTDGTNLYVADSMNHTIRKIVISTKEVTTYAGTAGVTGSADGIGTAASFRRPVGITSDGTNLFVADYENFLIRKIVIATREVTTLAGTALATGTTDGTGADARFNQPSGVTTDGLSLFVVDRINHTIRNIE